MNLHTYPKDFQDLQELTAKYAGIPAAAVKKDYYIVLLLQKLQQSPYAGECVFKGGTSLSKCYPGSISRFSEDIDLTFAPQALLGSKQYDRRLKQIEKSMAEGFHLEKIISERNDRNKSAYIWFDETDPANGRIKLEIGSSVRPEPYGKKGIRSYIQEYLEAQEANEAVAEYGLSEVQVQVLAIERTFLDKVLAVKRHAVCGTLINKIRHIYDVTALFPREDIQQFLAERDNLKALLHLTKKTDAFYLSKRRNAGAYNSLAPYDFHAWRGAFDAAAKKRYETLHKDLLFTEEKQDFSKALEVFERLDQIFASLGE